MLKFKSNLKTHFLSRAPALLCLICLILILTTLTAYWQVRKNEFINLDDDLYVTGNPSVQKGLTFRGTLWAFTRISSGHWHPMTWLSHMLDDELYGMDPSGHHMTNLFFHIANALLLFILLRRLTGAIWRSGFVAALFALHPLHVESAAWVAERKDVLCTFFWMLTLFAYSYYVRKTKAIRYLSVVLCFVLALMSKPMAVTLPFVLLLLDYWPLGRLKFEKISHSTSMDVQRVSTVHLILEKIPLLSLAAMLSLFTILAHLKSGAIASFDKLPFSLRIENALVSYIRYIGKMIWPDPLAVLYPHPMYLPLWEVGGAILLLTIITALVVIFIRIYPCLAVGWFWYLGTLLPVIGLVQAGVQAMADRFTYIPLIGLFMMVVYGLPRSLGRRGRMILIPSGILLLLILMRITLSQVCLWQNSVTLFSHTLNVTANNYLIHNNLGVTLMRQGKDQEAMIHYRKALEIKPNYADAYYNIGTVFMRQGKDQEALAHFLQALSLKPERAETHNQLGAILTRQGKVEEAIAHFAQAVRIDPDHEEARYNLGTVLLRRGRAQEAMIHFNRALQINPKDTKVHINMGLALAAQGEIEEALAHLKQAIQISPENPDAHYNLATLLAGQGRDQEALFHFNGTLRLNPEDVQAHYQMGVILFRHGKNEEAMAHLAEAIRMNPNYGEAHHALGWAYLKIGKRDLALAEYKTLQRINTHLADNLYQKIAGHSK